MSVGRISIKNYILFKIILDYTFAGGNVHEGYKNYFK